MVKATSLAYEEWQNLGVNSEIPEPINNIGLAISLSVPKNKAIARVEAFWMAQSKKSLIGYKGCF